MSERVLDIDSCLDNLETLRDNGERAKLIVIQGEERDSADGLLAHKERDICISDCREDEILEASNDIANNNKMGAESISSNEEDLSNLKQSKENPYIYNTASNNYSSPSFNAKLDDEVEKLNNKICDKFSNAAFDDNRRVSNPLGKYQCFVCSYNSTRKNYLSQHLVKHFDNRRPFKCPVCEKTFPTKNALKTHINCCADIRPHQCEQCPKAFTTPSALTRHWIETHSGMNRLKCPTCDYSTFHRKRLNDHMVVHMDVRPYKCDYCAYASTAKKYLTKHLRVHTGEKRHQCDKCHCRFREAFLLRKHRKKHFEKGENIHDV